MNIARTIIALKAANVWCIGLDAAGAPLSGPAFADRRVALVLGAEGEGLRRLTRETCDIIAGLSMNGRGGKPERVGGSVGRFVRINPALMPFDPLPAAQALRQIRLDRVPVPPLPAGVAPATAEEGAAVQAALAELVGAIPPAGFKIGATGSRMQAYLGVGAPIAGFMHAKDVYRGRADLRFADYIKPGAECEVAVRLARDLPPGPCTLDQALSAVGDFFAAIEIVENRYGDLKELGTPTLVADQMYHCAAVIGDGHANDWRSLGIGALRGRISLDNGTADEGVTTDLLGHPLNGLAWLAGSAEAAAFGGLKAGQVIMLGSVTPPVWLTGPATVTVAFPPLPTVTVRLG